MSIGIGINTPAVSIGINLPLFPQLVPVPGYPVYYAPQVSANYFFYDGMYWVFWDDAWYASSWYNGPWWLVQPEFVPLFILRVPVRYYRAPPVYFRHWHSHAPPRWGQHWGPRWEEHRRGWDRWDRRAVPTRAPLPVYQRRYSGERYPRLEEQRDLRGRNYRYEPRTRVVREHFREEGRPGSGRERQERSEPRGSREREMRGPAPTRQEGTGDRRSESPRRDEERFQRQAPVQRAPQERAPDIRDDRRDRGSAPREQVPRVEDRGQRQMEPRQIERRESSEPGRGRGQMEQRGEERGGGRSE
ncbi:MAG TPA: hypothetical protein VLA89_15115, partial [Gemmatimonadales bacterium]|nr:hypothetical protein [Gemmatimonadales bacterium]